MFIPTGMHFSVTVHGEVWKIVPCENCATKYAYRMAVSGSGAGTSFLFLNNEGAKAVAREAAEAQLQKRAGKSSAAVPCPVCGWYQRSMLRMVRRRGVHWAQIAGAVVLAVSLAFFLVLEAEAQAVAGGFAACGAALLAAGFVRKLREDPNAGDPEPRKQLGRSLAVWGEKLNEMLR
jgi:hypothetical protein